jgi:hypothetical protein
MGFIALFSTWGLNRSSASSASKNHLKLYEELIKSKDSTIAHQEASFAGRLADKDAFIARQDASFASRLADKDDSFASRLADKDAFIASQRDSIASQRDSIASRLADKEDVIAMHLELLLQEQSDKALLIAKYEGTFQMRPILESSVHSVLDRDGVPRESSTNAFNYVFKKYILDERRNDLQPKFLRLLQRLEPQNHLTLKNSVKHEFPQLFGKLSRVHHVADKAPGAGIYCGGEMKMRALCAVLAACLQKELVFPYPVIYADDKYQPLNKEIINGECIDVPATDM